jgi:predicted aspartyl protease
MLHGRIYEDRPLLPVTIGWKENLQDIILLVDTGYTGEVKLTPRQVQELGIEVTHTRDVRYGDGKPVTREYGIARVSLEGSQKTVSVLIDEGVSVIGVQLLRDFGYKLTVDFPSDEFVLEKKSEISFAE